MSKGQRRQHGGAEFMVTITLCRTLTPTRWERGFHLLNFDADRIGRSAAALARKRIV